MDNVKRSKDGRVTFYPDKHHYFLDGDKRLTGVTEFISRYKEEFNKEKKSKDYALKYDLVQADVLAGWKEKNDISLEQGHDTHDILENYVNYGLLPGETEVKWPKQVQALRFIKDYFQSGRLIPVEAEMIVYNDKIASQIDNISRSPKGEHFIFDYKTNEKIEMFSYRDRRMKHPFGKYMDCNFYHYSLQVGIYRKLCTEYDIKEAFIVHFEETCYKVLRPAPVFIPEYVLL